MDGYIFNDVKVGDFVDTGGVYYGPYNKVICIAKNDHRIALHIKGHYQFWGRQRHYISAHCTVFDIEPSNLEGSRLGPSQLHRGQKVSDIIIQVELSEFRAKVYHALPVFPETISLADLTRKIYKSYDAKRDKGRRSHVMKAMYDLWQMKIASHELGRRGDRWSIPRYYRRPMNVRIRIKPK